MSEKLESYLEEIGHYLSGREEREEILSEIRGHILEKAEREHGDVSDASLDRVISVYGSPRRVAEKYLEGAQIIAPAYKRYLVRYTSLLFAFHIMLVLVGFLGKKSVSLFPIFVPRMTFIEALAYLPMAFVFDLGLVGLVLYLITRSRRDGCHLSQAPFPVFLQPKFRAEDFHLCAEGRPLLFSLPSCPPGRQRGRPVRQNLRPLPVGGDGQRRDQPRRARPSVHQPV